MDISFTLEDIEATAELFLKSTGIKKVIAFYGEMGAGKTTFIHELCRKMNVESNLSSPTFSIINEYMLRNDDLIYHLDLYRINTVQEAIDAGVEECLYSGRICFVEWPSKAQELMPADTLYCRLSSLSDNKRKLQINL
ncbi:MAG: tRNA (adenosine(37)-N6)-threonylcarbamoyltransferase complex ATPase subunit type 1 TsaE [Ferruginibacter sp.]